MQHIIIIMIQQSTLAGLIPLLSKKPCNCKIYRDCPNLGFRSWWQIYLPHCSALLQTPTKSNCNSATSKQSPSYRTRLYIDQLCRKGSLVAAAVIELYFSSLASVIESYFYCKAAVIEFRQNSVTPLSLHTCCP